MNAPLHRACVRPLVLATLFVAALSGCGVNPVTGKKEIQLISESQEVQIGVQNYLLTRQSQGGDWKLDADLTTYVQQVGARLAAVSDRQLPYEFAVLNSSVPNAWALPGGKIAVNRGLLTALDNEAELAAVIGHEIVHAAARHGAKAQERGIFLQAGMIAAQIGVAASDINGNLGNLLVQGAGVGAQLVSLRYGREAELEADHYGTRYLKAAGYDPSAAVTLQQKFVKLAEADGRARQGWLDGLFASHPPSVERVQRNEQTVAALGSGGELGRERYTARLTPLRAMQPAYDKADAALAAANAKDLPRARALAAEAVRLLPREARFHQLQGDLALAAKETQAASAFYEKSMQLDPDYFGPWLGGGIAAYRGGDRARAEQWLRRSAELLPTAPALYYLGSIARDSGRMDEALGFFRNAAASNSEIGRQAATDYAVLDMPRNPANYVATAAQLDARGTLVAIIENRSPVAIAELVLTPVVLDAAGRVVEQGRALRHTRQLPAGERTAIDTGVGPMTAEALQRVRIRIDSARPLSR
ncbi:MAG: M48 family metalloprotease [Steroidobacteraceae bacterium]